MWTYTFHRVKRLLSAITASVKCLEKELMEAVSRCHYRSIKPFIAGTLNQWAMAPFGFSRLPAKYMPEIGLGRRYMIAHIAAMQAK
jgi:hypothetical protein